MAWKWFALSVLAAAIAVPVTAMLTPLLTEGGESSDPPGAAAEIVAEDGQVAARDPFHGGMRKGYGPARPTFRCARPTACKGPTYVTFNSYFNTPKYGFALTSQAESAKGWGIDVPSIPPSFSRITYIGFTVVAWPA